MAAHERGAAWAGADGDALRAVDAALAAHPGDRGLQLDRARLLAEAGRVDEAAQLGLEAIAAPGRLRPDDALAVVGWCRAVGRAEDALRVADVAIARGGPAPAVVEAALALELALGRPDDALGRLDGLPPTATWLDWRGRAAVSAGRIGDALDAWTRARDLAAGRPTPANRATVAALDDLLGAWRRR
ncbi:MAG: hypothetical protein R3F59_19495 [Myxococcota bacterium]